MHFNTFWSIYSLKKKYKYWDIHFRPKYVRIRVFDEYDKNNSKDLQNFAISQYLAFKNGSDKTIESVHKQVKGNKPVDLFIFNKLNEYTLGQLLCIYEYKTLFEASFSDINPFDQYGVELGKQIFKNL